MSKIHYSKAFTQYIVLILAVLLIFSPCIVSSATGAIFGSHAREGTPAEGSATMPNPENPNGEPTAFGCANVPLFRQNLSPWKDVNYGCGGTTIGSSGCGITSAAMVLKFYGKDVTPATMAEYSLEHGYRACGQGTAHGFFPSVAHAYGLQEKSNLSWSEIIQSVASGKPVIVSGKGSAPFTGSGHFIVITCSNEDGSVSVNDPARGTGTYDAGIVRNQMHYSSLIYE